MTEIILTIMIIITIIIIIMNVGFMRMMTKQRKQ